MNRITEILVEEPRIRDGDATRVDLGPIRGAVTFEDVSFGYNGRPVLEHLSFSIAAGQTAAVVGATGSGKSTLVALLTREYDPTSGRVLIDGVDAREIPVGALRDAIGYVPQDTFLFSDTVRANVAFGRPDASDGEVARACEQAQLAETVAELEHGYDTLLGERGVNLSGGQKQRLAIARALIRNPAILVLDDALSSVDTHTEERILEGLRLVMAQRTSIVISHRVSTVRHANVIFVLQDGRLVERGTHAELVRRGGVYADLYERQLLEEALEEA